MITVGARHRHMVAKGEGVELKAAAVSGNELTVVVGAMILLMV